jgi:4-hydroxyacetophenone monooxygenase
VDVIVMATGFSTDPLLGPIDVQGRGGRRFAGYWGVAPGAHLGITVPGFPNFFVIYGPGTNLAHAGSIIFHSECQMRFIGACISELLRGGYRSIEVRQDAFDRYLERYRDAMGRTVWEHSSVKHSWYKGPDGKVYVLSPWRLVDYWQMTGSVLPTECEFR